MTYTGTEDIITHALAELEGTNLSRSLQTSQNDGWCLKQADPSRLRQARMHQKKVELLFDSILFGHIKSA